MGCGALVGAVVARRAGPIRPRGVPVLAAAMTALAYVAGGYLVQRTFVREGLVTEVSPGSWSLLPSLGEVLTVVVRSSTPLDVATLSLACGLAWFLAGRRPR